MDFFLTCVIVVLNYLGLIMNNNQFFRLNRNRTPLFIRWTLILTLGISFFALISNALFLQVFKIPSPQYLFSLTTWGIHKLFLWQFISYLFIQPVTENGISISMILHVFFDLYLLWAIGSAIVEARGIRHFIGLYFGGGLCLGALAYLALFLLGSPLPFAGASTSIYILLIGWTFLFPDARLMLLLALPVRAKWLVFGMIGVNLFLDFSNGHFLSFIVTAGALTYGYLYSVLVWEILGPFLKLHEFEKKMIYFKRFLTSKFKKMTNFEILPSKIYDFKTGKAMSKHEQFVNDCLNKVSSRGTKSLSMWEKWRLHRKFKKKI